MADMFFGLSAYSRNRGSLPDLEVINMYAEPSQAADKGVILQSRSGLAQTAEVGAGPVYGLYQKDGAIGGNRYAVSGTGLYKDAAFIGAIVGSAAVSFASSNYHLLVTRGTKLYEYDGTTFAETEVLDPDETAQDIVAVASLAGYEIAVVKDSNKFQFRQENSDGWDGLDFANAENEPDALIDILVVNDQLVMLGTQSVEFWQKTGDSIAPFAPTQGRVYEKGVIGTGCATRFDNTFAWIGDSKIVYVGAGVPDRISDAGIEEKIGESTSFALYRYFYEGVDFLALRLSQGTWIFSAATRQWSEFKSWGQANWRARCAIDQNGDPVFGDDATGKLWRFDGFADDGGVLERRFTAAIPIRGSTLTAANVRLSVNPGSTSYLVGEYADPLVEMRTSRDAGRSYANYKRTALGAQGKYKTRVEWRRAGMFADPGMLAQFRVTAPIDFRVSSVSINEPSGGRSR